MPLLKTILHAVFIIAVFAVSGVSLAQESEQTKSVLFKNVNVFDGVSDQLHRDMHVLVTGNKISEVSSEPLVVIQSTNMQTIDGEGMTLMPGLIDSHTHLYATSVFQTFAGLQAAKWDQIGAMANEKARDYLYDGYTTIRDTGGMGGGLRELIDSGKVEGPRIYTAGAAIGPTSGHGDWRNPAQRTFDGIPSNLGTQLNL